MKNVADDVAFEGSAGLTGEHLLLALLRTHRIAVLLGSLAVCATVFTTLMMPRRFTSRVAIMPQGDGMSALGGLSSVAAQFGVDVGGGSPDQSPQFYDALIATGAFQEALAASEVRVSTRAGEERESRNSDLIPFVDWIGIDRDLPVRARITLAARKLRDIVRTAPSVHTSMLLIAVTSTDSLVSFDLARRTLALITDFNVARRSADAAAERKFVEDRVRVVEESLAVSEARVLQFLAENRDYSSSPRLSLAYERLRRRVTFFEGVTATLLQAEEQARIRELRRTPVVTVVEQPVVASLPDSRRLVLRVVLVVIVICVVWVAIVVLLLTQAKEVLRQDEVRAALREEVERIRANLRRIAPWRKEGS